MAFEVGDQVEIVGPASNPWRGRVGVVVQDLGSDSPFRYAVSVDLTQIVVNDADVVFHAHAQPSLDPTDDFPWDRWQEEWQHHAENQARS